MSLVFSPRLFPSTSCLSFFFYYSVHHRDLHSFPTRRSSDLSTIIAITMNSIFNHNFIGFFFFLCLSTLPIIRHRSEEHTSELQSRGHLVCRLLLEKKKKKK